ncbi:hypothetical protein BJ684DRAFT_14890 [Piptocephalis cylindrospora]|uniref:DNA-directed RNA polymerase III subunit RPC3 n=1 Tax=Piptocephalis cylindrospora TaxID=1907219 RepID=A0A4P9Y6Z0_9FUNG|nr:hypothetical protein BJ684DRAFT_14890 [Piptocephalis cylindrospora]|eukprot:RKP14805.1 hypothetical protein BJ684DRAFT_14890 [Piptocephalis cylindrospora]
MATSTSRLCSSLAEEHFGPLVGTVTEMLGRKGRMTLIGLQRTTGIKLPNLRQALFVLMHHHCVTYARTEEGHGKDQTYYMLKTEELLERAEFPAYLGVAKEAFGDEGVVIAKELMVHGSISLKALLERSASLSAENKPAALRKTFTQMTLEKYLRAVRPTDFITPEDRKMRAESLEIARLTGPATTKELEAIRARVALAQSEEDRKVLGLKRRGAPDEVGVGRASKRHASSGGDDLGSPVSRGDGDREVVDEDMLFRLSFPGFRWHLRNKALVRWISNRISPSASLIVQAMLSLTHMSPGGTEEVRSSAVGLGHISHAVPGTLDLGQGLSFPSDGPPPTTDRWELLLTYMEILVAESSEVILRSDDRGSMGGGEYVVDWVRFLRLRREETIVRMATERTGMTGARLWRLILRRGWLDEKGLGKMALLPAKEGRERIQALHQLGLVRLQEIPKSLDRAPNRTFYLWFIDLPYAYASIRRILLQTLGNVRRRREREVGERGHILRRMERPDLISDPSLISQADRLERDRLEKIVGKLRLAEGRLSGLVSLFG